MPIITVTTTTILQVTLHLISDNTLFCCVIYYFENGPLPLFALSATSFSLF